jgi:hypothetical protein
MPKLRLLLSSGKTLTADPHTQAAAIPVALETVCEGATIIGMQTLIDESSVYPADLSSPFHQDPLDPGICDNPGMSEDHSCA